jgi:hypothetical protein
LIHSLICFEKSRKPFPFVVRKTTKELSSSNPVWCTKVGRTTRFSTRKTTDRTQRPTGTFLVSLAISQAFFISFVYDFSTPITSAELIPGKTSDKKAKINTPCVCHYAGTLIDGTEVCVCVCVFAELTTYRTVCLVCSGGCPSLNAGWVRNPSNASMHDSLTHTTLFLCCAFWWIHAQFDSSYKRGQVRCCVSDEEMLWMVLTLMWLISVCFWTVGEGSQLILFISSVVANSNDLRCAAPPAHAMQCCSHKQTDSTSLSPLPQTKSSRAGPRLCNSWTRVPRYVLCLFCAVSTNPRSTMVTLCTLPRRNENSCCACLLNFFL